jgi:two-component system, cell cycle sensor histidine kinase PleC
MAVPEAELSHSVFTSPAASAHILRQKLRGAYETIAQSIRPGADNAWLVNAQLDLCRRGAPYFVPSFIAGSFLISQLFAPWVSLPLRTAWWLGVAFVCILTDRVIAHVDRHCDGSPEATRRRAYVTLVATALLTLAWASMNVFLRVPGIEVNHVLLTVVLACTLAGSTVFTAPHPAVAAANLLIYAIIFMGPLATSELTIDRSAAWLAGIYLTMMAGEMVAMHATSRRMLALEHERQQLVEGLQRAREESDREHERAVAAGRTKSQFLSNMNHELRTPMNAILGFSELIVHKSFGDAVDKYAEYAEIIHDSGQRLLALIDDMFDLAKIEAGKLSLRETTVDLRNVVADAVDAHEAKANSGQIELTTRIAQDFPSVRADERAVRQIIGNLLSNAVKFTPAGGRVAIFAHVEPDGRPAFGVEDTGIGIAEEDQESVFERFGRGRHDVVTMTKGTGLGLAVVKGFAEAHDGEVKLESALGEGTRVTVYLPAARTSSEPQQACTAA